MKTKAERFQVFSEMGDRVALSLSDGQYLEGYILGIAEGRFEFAFGGPMAPEASSWFDIEAVDFGSLSFFSEALGRYVEAGWTDSA